MYRSVCMVVITGFCFFYLLSSTWFKWGDLIVDTFRDMWVPMQILEGKAVYRDVFYTYGLFPPYFIALLFALFGTHLNALVGCGIGITIFITILLYKISRIFLDIYISCLVLLTFLFVFAFACYYPYAIFNFILPYSNATTFCILFVCLSIYSFLRYIFSNKNRYLVLWIASICFAFFSRIDITLPVWTGYVLTGFIYIVKDKSRKRVGIYLLVPFFISIAFYLIYLTLTGSFDGFKVGIINYVILTKTNPFNRMIMGMQNVPHGILLIIKSLLLHLGIIALCLFGVYCISSWYKNKNYFIGLLAGVSAITIVFAYAPKLLTRNLQYSCLPFILIIGMVYFFYKFYHSKHNHDIHVYISVFLIFCISSLTMLRVFFNSNPTGYGFALLCPAIICYYVFFFRVTNMYISRYINRYSKALFSFVLICFFMYYAFQHWNVSYTFYKKKNISIMSDKGHLFSYNTSRTAGMNQTIKYLREETQVDDKIVVFPEGVILNIFSNRVTPLRYSNFIPSNIDVIGEDEIHSSLTEADIQYVIIVHRPTHEYGSPYFGIHYGKKIYSWIKENYTLVYQVGDYPFESRNFGIAIFQKKHEL